jgi:hypothetical protein
MLSYFSRLIVSFLLFTALSMVTFGSLSSVKANELCGPNDPDCAGRISDLLANHRFLETEFRTGVQLSEETLNALFQLHLQTYKVDATNGGAGDVSLLGLGITWLPDEFGFVGGRGIILDFELLGSEVMFFCELTDPTFDERWLLPPKSLFESACQPATWGVGGKLIELHWDTVNKRFAARWLELDVVYNFLKNAYTDAYEHSRLLGKMGVSGETTWNCGSGDCTVKGALRLNLALTGMLRSDNYRWELNGSVGYRPNLLSFTNDYAIEARGEGLHRFLVKDGSYAEVGIDLSYQYWSDPLQTIGSFATPGSHHTRYAGGFFRIVFDSLGLSVK